MKTMNEIKFDTPDLWSENEKLRKELRLHKKVINTLPLCPGCRGKYHEETCLACDNERLEKERDELKEALFYAQCEVMQSEETEKRLMKERDDLRERAGLAGLKEVGG